MHPALRKGPRFFTKNTPIFHFFYKTPPISFPAYGPGKMPATVISRERADIWAGHASARSRRATGSALMTTTSIEHCDRGGYLFAPPCPIRVKTWVKTEAPLYEQVVHTDVPRRRQSSFVGVVKLGTAKKTPLPRFVADLLCNLLCTCRNVVDLS